eukprot:3596368-Lingulodinium_polyedra.AAC.1
MDDPRSGVFTRVVEWAGELARRGCLWAAVLENVTGMRQAGKDGTSPLSIIMEMIKSILKGFSVSVWEVAATDCGLPQMRTRLYIVAWRN